MSKLQTIMCLFVFIIIILSMDTIFGNPLRETFKGSSKTLGSDLDYKPIIRQNKLNGNMGNPNAGFLAAKIPPSYTIQSDDQPLSFGFSF
jgi:hypothetical protein